MKTRKISIVGIVLAGVLLMLQAPLGLVAQEPPPQDQGPPPQSQGPAQDPPGRVARLSYSVGSVSFQPGGEGDWVEAVANRPLTTGDNLWADKDSRAELQTGSTSIRMDSETSVTFLDLDDRTTQLKLSQGSIIVRVRHLDDEDHFEIDTPNLAFQIQRTGEYRIDVNADGTETDARVWNGRGEATGGGNSYIVVANQLARFTGTDQLNHEIDQIPNRDDFDNFAFQRDEREDHAEANNYISPEMTGAADLDEYGHWHYAADYGPVWTPVAVAPGWAPYRYGHWVWVAPWGWTWVEDEPWGFAPFHYGRWAFVESSWCWVPGPVYVRPVYAPALVAFVGGGGFSAGVGIGAGVAWFPLAPREVYVPWYRTSPRYVNNVNITNTRVNVTQVTNVYNTTIINNNTTNVTRVNYVNQHVNNGVTVVSHDTFVNARPVQGNLTRVNSREMENAPVVHSIAAQPVRQSVVGAGRPVNVRPPATVTNRQVVATRQPPPPREPFGQGHTAEPNVRTEAPAQPQTVTRTPAEPPRPGQPAARPTETTRPQAPPVQANQAPHPQVPSNSANNRPTGSPNIPRPGATQPQQSARQPEPMGQHSMPNPPAAQNAHPLVRPAPPVRENPQHQQNEQAKFNAWQQQRGNPAPRAPEPRVASQPRTTQAPTPQPPAHEEKHR
jgi:FecR protein